MPRIEHLSSPANPLLKEIRRAVSRGDMVNDGLWIAEGFHLLAEAFRSELKVPFVLVSELLRDRVESLPEGLKTGRLLVLPDELFQTIAATEASQGVMALVQPPEWEMEHLFRGRVLVLILDGVQDPGNAGAVMRVAEAFEASGVICTRGSVNPWNPKALRASAGSTFRVPFVSGIEAGAVGAVLQQYRLDVWAAMPWKAGSLVAADVDFARPAAIIIGSEGRGIGDVLYSIARAVAIPTSRVESLNASTAAAILLYEAHRQRRRGAAA